MATFILMQTKLPAKVAQGMHFLLYNKIGTIYAKSVYTC